VIMHRSLVGKGSLDSGALARDDREGDSPARP